VVAGVAPVAAVRPVPLLQEPELAARRLVLVPLPQRQPEVAARRPVPLPHKPVVAAAVASLLAQGWVVSETRLRR
jgi:hypothetical protein